jgi:histidine ammonia-lyase
VKTVLEREVNACTDNPLVFVDAACDLGGDLVSGGNFHGQPIALALDFATMALAEIGNVSERRVEQLVNPHYSDGLPPFLAPHSGLNSGFMVAQYSAAALVSENKVLSHPACVDSIPTSAGREDHVSMGATSALKLARVHDHVKTVLAIEFLCAAQGLDLRAPLKPGPIVAAVHREIRKAVPPMLEDRPVHADMAAVRKLIDDGSILAAVKTEAL